MKSTFCVVFAFVVHTCACFIDTIYIAVDKLWIMHDAHMQCRTCTMILFTFKEFILVCIRVQLTKAYSTLW